MLIQQKLRALKKSAMPCTVEYGKTLSAEGVIVDFKLGATGRVWMKTGRGEIGIPLSDVRRIDETHAENG